MAAGEEDVVLGFLARFASMSEKERDAAVDALTQEERDALIALAQSRATAAEDDLLRLLSSGNDGLERLREVHEPSDLLSVINLAVRERPELVVEALFATLVIYRGWDSAEPEAVAELRERWHMHIHQQPVEPLPREEPRPARSSSGRLGVLEESQLRRRLSAVADDALLVRAGFPAEDPPGLLVDRPLDLAQLRSELLERGVGERRRADHPVGQDSRGDMRAHLAHPVSQDDVRPARSTSARPRRR